MVCLVCTNFRRCLENGCVDATKSALSISNVDNWASKVGTHDVIAEIRANFFSLESLKRFELFRGASPKNGASSTRLLSALVMIAVLLSRFDSQKSLIVLFH